jgi:hypothetical protein
MDHVRALLTTRSGPVGSMPDPKVLAVEDGTRNKVPSVEFRETVRDAMRAASHVAGDGMVTEVRVLFIPGDLPSAN